MQIIEKLYGPFFSGADWHAAIMTTNGWIAILTLTIMECLLSVDNAVVLATQTSSLHDKHLEKRALMYGLWGSYIFRFIAIGLGAYLIKFWIIKAIGAGYLLYMAIEFFYKQHNPVSNTERASKQPKTFMDVVSSIILLDVVFSIDSIITALAIDSNPVIVLIGGMIGILAMRFVAQLMINLLDKVPELLYTAYLLIGIISVKLGLSLPAIGIEIPNVAFGVIVVIMFIVTYIWHKTVEGRKKNIRK